METGRVVEWHIAEGNRIEEGELLVSIETDKAIADIESPVSGVLLRIVGQVDGVYDVGATLAWIGEEGEEVPGEPAEQAQAPAAEQAIESRATPVALRLAQRHGIDAEALQGTGPGERVTKEDVQRAIDDGTATPQKAPSEAPAPSPAAQPKEQAADRPAGSRVTPVALRLAQRHGIDAEALQGTGPGGRITKEDVQRAIDDGTATPVEAPSEAPAPSEVPVPSPAAQPKEQAADRPAGSRVTPVALRLAQRHGIDAEALQGTGPGGRITKEDVQRAIDDGTATPVEAPSEAPAPSEVPVPSPAAQPKEQAAGVEVIPLAGIRRTTAERLGAIWSQAPHVTEGIEVDFTALQAARTANADAWRNAYGIAPTLNDFVLKATAEALKSYPQLNAALIDDAIHQYSDINLGVAIDIESGLVVPVVRKVDTLGVIALAGQVRELADRARNGKLGLDDFTGGTFTVTNLGGLGVDWFTPVLNPPQCAILGVGRVREAAVVADRSIQFRDVATLVLTFDHRAIDGAPCARFLADLRARIEDPGQLLP
jgi:pyruvate/2-oxoglutarate dehydrogenase complex dihydrolipoamide acyltransferase (E2) component